MAKGGPFYFNMAGWRMSIYWEIQTDRKKKHWFNKVLKELGRGGIQITGRVICVK